MGQTSLLCENYTFFIVVIILVCSFIVIKSQEDPEVYNYLNDIVFLFIISQKIAFNHKAHNDHCFLKNML